MTAARASTAGRNHRASRSAVRSIGALSLRAAAVSSMTRPTTVCSATRWASMVRAPSWLSEPASTSSPGPFSAGRLSPVKALDVQRRAALDDHAVGRHAGAGLDHDAVAGAQVGDEDALLAAVGQPPAAARTDGDDGADGPLGPLEGDVFEAFAEQADEDDFLGDFRPAGEDGGDAGDGDGQVGADAALEKGVEGAVKDAGAAEDGGDEGEAEAEAEQSSPRRNRRTARARDRRR